MWQELPTGRSSTARNRSVLLEGLLPVGTRLYDLTVADDHSFVIEGLVSHNSNCRCELDVTETDDGWEVYWLDLGDERECTDCRQLAASWSPLQLNRPRAAPSQEE
jgi:hypothetical protein